MQYIPVYARRKNSQEAVTYLDPLEAITGNTYGISVYQEQSMEIAKQIAGFTPAEADDLRKAIGKKNHSLMASLTGQVYRGLLRQRRHPCGCATALGRPREGAGLLLQQVARGRLRADRLSHRVAESAYPPKYMAALISSAMNTKYRVPST